MADPKELGNLFQEIHNTSLMLWQSLTNAMLKKGVIERYELADAITDSIEQMGEDAQGLPENIGKLMTSQILGGVEPAPEIDPTTARALDQISRHR